MAANIRSLLDKYTQAQSNNNDTDAQSSASTRQSNMQLNVKLPVIQFSKFTGEPDAWLEFRDTFLSLINENEALNHIQKFHYLRASLTGKAVESIKNMASSAENYLIAWSSLNGRYNNKRVLVFNHLRAIFNIEQIQKESSAKLRKMIDCLSKNLRSIKNLIPTETLWELLINFLITSKLDPSTTREWKQVITNCSI